MKMTTTQVKSTIKVKMTLAIMEANLEVRAIMNLTAASLDDNVLLVCSSQTRNMYLFTYDQSGHPFVH